jgi:hypothetical protein
MDRNCSQSEEKNGLNGGETPTKPIKKENLVNTQQLAEEEMQALIFLPAQPIQSTQRYIMKKEAAQLLRQPHLFLFCSVSKQ